MDVTSRLVKVFLVEKQLRGLKSRLTAAEKFLNDQSSQLTKLNEQKQTLDGQLKQLKVKAAEFEGETKRLDARMDQLKEQMNSAQTNKEYKAFLTEINTIKAERDRLETQALEQMAKLDEARKQGEALEAQRGEREKLRGVADEDRKKRAAEIQGRLSELELERKAAAGDVPGEVLSSFVKLVAQRGEDAMATVEIHDFKRHEFTCGACQMSLPVEVVSGLMSTGKITRCVSCQCYLYLDEAAREATSPPTKGGKAAAGKK